MLLFVPPYCRCHDDGRFRFTVIGYGLGLAVTSRLLWTAPYTNEKLDVDTSKGPKHGAVDSVTKYKLFFIYVLIFFYPCAQSRKKSLFTLSCPSVCPHLTARIPMDGLQ
jgi:hypothetical protein